MIRLTATCNVSFTGSLDERGVSTEYLFPFIVSSAADPTDTGITVPGIFAGRNTDTKSRNRQPDDTCARHRDHIKVCLDVSSLRVEDCETKLKAPSPTRASKAKAAPALGCWQAAKPSQIAVHLLQSTSATYQNLAAFFLNLPRSTVRSSVILRLPRFFFFFLLNWTSQPFEDIHSHYFNYSFSSSFLSVEFFIFFLLSTNSKRYPPPLSLKLRLPLLYDPQ
jgi:hypothetical protein